MNQVLMIETGARLHFGLLDLTGDLGRVDGGIGMALSDPKLVIKASLAEGVSSNLHGDLVRSAVMKLNKHFGRDSGMAVELIDHYPQHVGLGSTTQLLLSIGKAYAEIHGLHVTPRQLAMILERGGTSGIGLAAFEHGGFILDGGHTFGPGSDKETYLPSRASTSPPAPLLFRAPLPPDWVIDLIVPESSPGLFGQPEIDFFQEYCPVDERETSRIAHIILSCVLPAVVEHDIATFIRGINLLTTLGFKRFEILNQFNGVKEALRNLNQITQDQAAVGMSSFGPTLFIIWKKESRSKMVDDARNVTSDLLAPQEPRWYVAHCRNYGASFASLT